MVQSRALSVSPLVSILTPSFNQVAWLGDNLTSVRTQTYQRIEHIVADGGSSDGSQRLLAGAGASVHWTSEPDGGQSAALNKAFERSRGEIIGWLNSDDAYFSKRAVELAVRHFVRHPHIDVLYGHAALVNRDNLILQIIWAPPFHRQLLTFHNFIIQPTVFIRRSALNGSFIDERFQSAMDRELWLRLACRGHQFGRIDSVLAIDRHYPARKAVARRDLANADRQALIRMYGIPCGRSHRVALKALTIGLRLSGTAQALRLARGSLAFNGQWDRRGRLMIRQLITPRRRMPGCA